MLDPRPFLRDDLLQLLADIREDVAELVALLELLTLAAQPFAKVVESGEIRPRRVAGPPAALHQPAKRLGQVALGHDVVGQGVKDLVGVESRDRLGPVPAGVARRPGKERIANRRLAGRLPQVARVGAERGHAAMPSR